MPGEVSTGDDELLSILKLLAEGAPAGRLEALLQRVRREDRHGPERLAGIESAVQLARVVSLATARSHQREAGLAALIDTARDLSSPSELDGLLPLIARWGRRLLHFDMTYIALPDAEGMYVRCSEGSTTALNTGLRLGGGRGLGAEAMRCRAPLWTADYSEDGSIAHSDTIDGVVEAEGLRALMAVPLLQRGEALGVLYGADRRVRNYTPDEIDLICSLADIAAVAIGRVEQLQRAREQLAESQSDGARVRTRLTRLGQMSAMYRRIMDLLIDGTDLDVLVDTAGSVLGSTLQIRDLAGHVLAAGGEIAGVDEDALNEAVLEAYTCGGPARVGDRAWATPVTAGKEVLGSLVLYPAAELLDEDVWLLRTIAQVFALQLVMERSGAVAEGSVRDELLEELLSLPAGAPVPRQITQRATRLGIDLDSPHVLLVARPEGGEPKRAGGWASSYAFRVSGLKMVDNGRIVLMVPGTDASATARAVADELSPLLGHPVSVGAAGPQASAAEAGRSYREAVRCLDALTALDGVGGVASVQDLGFLGLLLSDDNDVDGFIESALGPVLDYDTDRTTELIATLEQYFAAGSSPTNAAERLHVHPNTVSRRIERITELLGEQWNEPERALEVQLALRLRRARQVLGARRSS
ncbi:helix-turn-helix domain-containing protein [Streptomyces sp. NPDC060184]|uniref:helix-turn-helix domain-containing protein n=1 Tax=Streptomyces sp. NPDC060184 TaxID=3347064 RepID=UPI003667A99A